jgi:hypothetical protein
MSLGESVKIKVQLVFDDWRMARVVGSIYSTKIGVELSKGNLHSGSCFDAEIEIDDYEAQEIIDAWERHEAYPVFSVTDAQQIHDGAESGQDDSTPAP